MSGRSNLARARAGRHRLLADPTRLAIVDALAAAPRSVAELAAIAGVHENTIRAHLRRLRAAGLLEEEQVRRAGPGRPAKRFRLLEAPLEHGREYRLLVQGLAALLRAAHGGRTGEVATEEGFRLGLRLGAELSRVRGPRGRVRALLEELSFAPRVRREGPRTVIDLLHCPFWGGIAEREGDVVCSFHLGLLRGAARSAGGDPADVTLEPFVEPRRCRVRIAAT
ncbi:MAG TPA: helix-turn-helix domain-containing protein [Actinomycetota bacterium]|nr:helix-turn-helix domain-containing protein [Actinomycetota bacterium]